MKLKFSNRIEFSLFITEIEISNLDTKTVQDFFETSCLLAHERDYFLLLMNVLFSPGIHIEVS